MVKNTDKLKNIDVLAYEVEENLQMADLKIIVNRLQEQFSVLDIFTIEGDSSIAYVFVSGKTADALYHDYKELSLSIKLLMNDMVLENDDNIYEFLFKESVYHYIFGKRFIFYE